MKTNCVILAALIFAVTNGPLAHAQPSSLAADLAFNMKCNSAEEEMLEDRIEFFLKGLGFSVLNQGKIQREHRKVFFAMRIVAIDKDNRIVKFTGFLQTSGVYSVALYSEPPTRRASDLESGLQKFSSEMLSCHPYEVLRGQNDVDARGMFDADVKRIEDLFREAKKLLRDKQI
jgi:hypothetical protein